MTITNVLQMDSLLINSKDSYSWEEQQMYFIFLSSITSENKQGSWLLYQTPTL